MGYAPTYSLATKPFFYIAGNFNQIFNEKCYKAIKSSIYNSLLKTVNNFIIKPTNNESTLRQVNIKDFDCIYHVEFKYLPELLFRQFLNGNLILYEDYQLLNVITHSKDFIPNPKDIKSLVLCEQWTDTTISNKDLHPNPLPFNTDYIIKKITSLGLTLPNKKTVWLDYEAYKAILTKSALASDNYKFTIYDLYFQSSFCRQMKMDMIVK